MLKPIARAIQFSLVLPLTIYLTGALAWAHGVVGDRMFVEPIITEDANVKNELDLPSMDYLVQPDGSWRSVGFSFEKTLYPGRFSVVFDDSRSYVHTSGRSLAGWENFELGLKWEAFANAAHELVVSPILFVELPTGSAAVTQPQTSLRPMLAYGKGLGDLPVSWLRPFGIQGDVGFEATVTGPRNQHFIYDELLFYSLPYLHHVVRQDDDGHSMDDSLRLGFSRGALLADVFPFVEFNSTKAVNGVAGGTASTLRPGILWMGRYAQVNLGADCPINRPGIAGRRHVGASILVDWYLDEIFPRMNWTPWGKHNHGDHN